MKTKNLTVTGETLTRIALKAGKAIMNFYENPIEVETKKDESPVTKADKAAEKIILVELETAFPDIPVISEEAASEGIFPEIGDTFFLVDPLDGTREFINKNGEFTVNIALIQHSRPIAGIVYAPALLKAFYGEKSHGAWSMEIAHITDETYSKLNKISARRLPENGRILVGSRSHGDPKQEEFKKIHHIGVEKAMGSSLKFCIIAEGGADIYPRFGRTMEWDTAAAQAVLEAAGGSVVDMDHEKPLPYGKKERGYDNPPFIAFGRRS